MRVESAATKCTITYWLADGPHIHTYNVPREYENNLRILELRITFGLMERGAINPKVEFIHANDASSRTQHI